MTNTLVRVIAVTWLCMLPSIATVAGEAEPARFAALDIRDPEVIARRAEECAGVELFNDAVNEEPNMAGSPAYRDWDRILYSAKLWMTNYGYSLRGVSWGSTLAASGCDEDRRLLAQRWTTALAAEYSKNMSSFRKANAQRKPTPQLDPLRAI